MYGFTEKPEAGPRCLRFVFWYCVLIIAVIVGVCLT